MARLATVIVIAAASRAATAQQLPVEEFFKRPEYSQLMLSPNGREVAAIVRGSEHDALAVFDVETRKGRRITNFVDGDVLRFYWTNDERLLFSVGRAHEATQDTEFYGWFAVNIDGSDLRRISEARPPAVGSRLSAEEATLRSLRYLSPDPEGGDNIIVAARERQGGTLEVYRYHTKTGEMKLLTREHPANVFAWLVDRAGQVRLAGSVDRGIVRIWYRDSEGAPWQKLDEEPQGRLKFRPLAFDFDNRTLYVAAYRGEDKAAIYRYDFEG